MIYQLNLVLHVVTAVVTLGPLLAVALGVQDRRLPLIASLGLAVMLLTGLGMLAITQWAYVHTLWLRASGALFLVIGALLGRLRRHPEARPLAWTALGLVAMVTALMEAKPQ